MSEANELLDSLTEDQISLYSVNPETEEPIVINSGRIIEVPDSLKRIAVQHDHNIETVTFNCPRYWDNNDLTEMYIYINYLRSDRVKGRYLAKNVRVDDSDENLIHFDWTIGNEITMAKGNITFLVCAVKTGDEGVEELHWNTELNNQMFVSEGLECTEAVLNANSDIINDLLYRMDNIITNQDYVLDKTLATEGLAADAKAAGDAINNETLARDNADKALQANIDATNNTINHYHQRHVLYENASGYSPDKLENGLNDNIENYTEIELKLGFLDNNSNKIILPVIRINIDKDASSNGQYYTQAQYRYWCKVGTERTHHCIYVLSGKSIWTPHRDTREITYQDEGNGFLLKCTTTLNTVANVMKIYAIYGIGKKTQTENE